MAAGVVLSSLLVGSISVAIHIAMYCWIYKPRMKLQSSAPAEHEEQEAGIGESCDSATYDAIDEKTRRVPKMKQNEAYNRGPLKTVPEIKQNEAYGRGSVKDVTKIKQNEAYGRGALKDVPETKQNKAYGRGPPLKLHVPEKKAAYGRDPI